MLFFIPLPYLDYKFIITLTLVFILLEESMF